MTDEEKVRAAWERVDKLVLPAGSVVVRLDSRLVFRGPNHAEAFKNVAAFTAKHKQAIADVDEEIVLLTCMIVMLRSEPGDQTAPVYQRTIDRLRAHRAELASGMRPAQHKESR